MTRAPAEVGSAANSYEILAKLAMGGMAEIFLARGASAAGVERYVVLKRVLRHRASDVHFVQMFLDEARLAAQLQHPNIAQVYDIGKLGDSYFFTMEYVHGETVRNLLSRSHGLRRQIPLSAVLSIIAGAAGGLHHAHERKGIDGRHLGIVHRDVSPSNLMVSYEGTVKVVDFGVAKAAHRSTETQSGTVKGKISYMSPEQCRGNEIDRRSDLFSLGIVMWEMLTTEKLFRRASDFETMTAIVGDDIPPPSRLRPEIPPDIDHVVMRLLAKDPAQRFQTGDELHEAIETVAVRTGSALSTASLGRYMRELFGQRPEPWIELQTQDQLPEAFTVTSEPIPNNLALSPAEEFDRKLSAVPALTQRMETQQDPRPPMPTIPLRVGPELVTPLATGNDADEMFRTNPIEREPLDEADDGDHVDAAATQRIRESAPRVKNVVELPVGQVGRTTPMVGAPSMPVAVPVGSPSRTSNPVLPNTPAPSAPGANPPTYNPDSGVVIARPHTPSATPASNPHYPIASASHPALGGQSPYPVAPRPQEPRRSRALLIIVPAAVIGIVIGIALALGGGKRELDVAKSGNTTMMVATPEPVPTAAPSPDPATVGGAPTGSAAPGPAVAAPVALPDEPIAKPKPSVTAHSADEATRGDKPSGVAKTDKPSSAEKIDKANSGEKTDKPSSAAKTDKASSAVKTDKPGSAKQPEKASSAESPDAASDKPDRTDRADKPSDKADRADRPEKSDRPATKPKLDPDVGVLFKAGDYTEVVATCSSATKVVDKNAITCTVAACKAKQAVKAKRWFAQVAAAKKPAVVKDCDGVIPGDKPQPAVDPCKADPMACQH